MENTNLEIITYPHYDKLPKQLKHNINIMRANVVEVLDETDYETKVFVWDTIELLTLDLLSTEVSELLPEYDLDFMNACARIHRECFEDDLFDYFGVEEEDLYVELLHIKDALELKLARQDKYHDQ